MVENRTKRFQQLFDQDTAISHLAAYLEEDFEEDEPFDTDNTEDDTNYVPDGDATDAEKDLLD